MSSFETARTLKAIEQRQQQQQNNNNNNNNNNCHLGVEVAFVKQGL